MKADEFCRHLSALALDDTRPGDKTQGVGTLLVKSSRAASKLVGFDGQSTSPEFALGETIGEGGMGIVRLADQIGLRREVAIKTLKGDQHSENDKGVLMHEAVVAGGLEHPNIVPIYTLSQTPSGAPAIVMKRIEGVSWYQCMKDPSIAPGYDGTDLLGWHLDVLSLVCRAVHFAHAKGIVHRDIKPENVMLGAFGEVYLVDWGIAVTLDDAKSDYLVHAKDANGIAGTPAYMAPEMTMGQGAALGTFTDIYLLGATLCEILTGRPPHRGKVLVEVLYSAYQSTPIQIADAPQELVAICHRAMHANPERRYDSADSFRKAIHDYSTHRVSSTLVDEACTRLVDLEVVVQASDASDAKVRGLAGEIRFGLDQALKIWPESAAALATQQRWMVAMASWELSAGNLPAAERIAKELATIPESLASSFARAREAMAEREAEISRLQALRSDVDQGHGARTRAVGALIAVLVWTLLPIAGGIRTGWGASPLSQDQYLARCLLVPISIGLYWLVLLRRSRINQATRSIMRLLVVFAAIIPLFRFVAIQNDITSAMALSIEQLIYGFVFAALGILSGRSGLPGFAFYGTAAVACTVWPNYTYAFLAGANFLSLSWLARIWASQATESS